MPTLGVFVREQDLSEAKSTFLQAKNRSLAHAPALPPCVSLSFSLAPSQSLSLEL
jgi:hypothetical protein